jgi:hypothetical protein
MRYCGAVSTPETQIGPAKALTLGSARVALRGCDQRERGLWSSAMHVAREVAFEQPYINTLFLSGPEGRSSAYFGPSAAAKPLRGQSALVEVELFAALERPLR